MLLSLFFPVVLLGLTLSPSGDGMTVLVLVNAPLFGHICRIGRVVLSVEGGMGACVLNREGEMVGNGRLGSGFGWWNCLGRVKWLRDLIKLLVGHY